MQRTDEINLKICLINAENLFLLFDQEATSETLDLTEVQWKRLSKSTIENKSLRKNKELSRALKEIDADIILFCEVGGGESLKNFNHLFMDSAYSPALIEGNSDRSIDVGFLIRKGLPFYFDLQTNKNKLINYLYPHEKLSLKNEYPIKSGRITTSHKFSRDCVELHLFTSDKSKPFMIFLLTHLKSRLDPERIDPNGFERRQAELNTILDIYSELSQTHPNIPILVSGDFNGNASRINTDEEFKAIYEKTKLDDVLEISNLPHQERATFYQVRSGGRADGKQIDFCFLDANYHKNVAPNAEVFRYRDHLGKPQGIPSSIDEKILLPSDHYPIVFQLTSIKTSP